MSRSIHFVVLLLAVVSCSLCVLTATGHTPTSFSLDVATGYNTTCYKGHSVNVSGQFDANWLVNPPNSWRVQRAEIVAATDADFPVGYWAPNGPNSSWINYNASGAVPGVATYTHIFTLPSLAELHTVLLSGLFACDNSCNLTLNGHFLATYTLYTPPATNGFVLLPFNASCHFFKSGCNTLTIRNYGDGKTDGVRLQGFVTGSLEVEGGCGCP